MTSQKEKIEAMYQDKENVDVFDSTRKQFAFQKYKHKIESQFIIDTIEFFDYDEKVKVLDVACGTGRIFKELANYYFKQNVEYHGVDTSEEMMSSIKPISEEFEMPVNLKVGDAMKLPYDDNTFDVTYSLHLTWHLPKGLQYQMINEMKRVTKPGGFVVFDILNENFIWEKYKHLLGKKKLTSIYKLDWELLEAGFKEGSYEVEKLSDFPIKSTILYNIANVVNIYRKNFPKNWYHMLYYRLEV